MAKELRDYGPIQMGRRLDLSEWQIQRALSNGLIPRPDVKGHRWSADVVNEAYARIEEIKRQIGDIPDCGANRAAEVLSRRFGFEVYPDAIPELSKQGALPEVGHYKEYPLYCGRTLEDFTDIEALQRAIRNGKLLTTSEAVDYLDIRESDFNHLVRANWIEPARWVRTAWQPRRDAPKVPLYRTGALEALANHPSIDWEEVRATPRGKPSPLARLSKIRGR